MTTPEPYSAGTVWVESVLDPGEPFRIKLHLNQRTWTLGRAGAVRYALAVLQAAHYADYDAATLALLVKTGVSVDAAGRLITEDLQPDRKSSTARVWTRSAWKSASPPGESRSS